MMRAGEREVDDRVAVVKFSIGIRAKRMQNEELQILVADTIKAALDANGYGPIDELLSSGTLEGNEAKRELGVE
jgi:hypothetical protein